MWNDKPHSRARFESETVAWLTTVSASGTPSTAPVWYIFDGEDSIIVYSRDPSIRVRNILANPKVTLALNSDPHGGDIVVVNGSASVDETIPPAHADPAFVARYQHRFDVYQWTPVWFSENYPTPIRITIRSIRGE